MSTLGEILARFDDPAEAYQILVESGNAPLVTKLDKMASEAGGDPCDLAFDAVRDFLAEANDEAWVKLIGRMQDSSSPAGSCLSEMIAWALNRWTIRQKGAVLGVVLAGGASSRYGSDKALAPLDGIPLLQRIVDQVGPQVDKVVLSGMARPGYAVEVIADEVVHAGPLAALKTTLAWAEARKFPLVMTFPCDAPFVPADTVKRLRVALRHGDCAVARRNGHDEPTCALWRTASRAKVDAALASGIRSLRDAMARVDATGADFSGVVAGPNGDPFFNINTRAAMADAEAWLRRKHTVLA